MNEMIVKTFDWVPDLPRGHVRDLRVRWALEEAGLPYRVEGVPFRERDAGHFAHQPFGQVPWLIDGEVSVFESGAILLYLGERSDALLPNDAQGRNEVIQWVFAALNSMEMASVPWSIFMFSNLTGDTPGWKMLDGFIGARVQHVEAVLAQREWLAGRFSIADILMSDVLRLVDRFGRLSGQPACRAYIARATARPGFIKAHADQIAFYAAADRAGKGG
ncbi:glutathione S-transferase family protein [Solimonas soli]|uniref:glutathione S-transferase family protein n=1 Tax=Solimonas soli TaxID=413479 RepID=UPI0004835113|nr:glutathione S-transferase family protein [Solimonas soli]